MAKAAAEAAEKAAKEYAAAAEKAAAAAAEKEKAAEAARIAAEKAQKKAEAQAKKIAEQAKKMEKDFNAFTLSRKAVGIRSAKSMSKGKLKLTVKKDKLAQGYQLQCAVKKNFKGSRRSKVTRSTSYTFGSLKKKAYYVRVRAYTSDSKGNRVYSKWSKAKKVRVK